MGDLEKLFQERVLEVGGEVEVAENLEDAAMKIAEKASSMGEELVLGVRLWKDVANLLEEVFAERGLKLVKVDPLSVIDSSTVSRAMVSIGAAEFGIAESGTIVYFARAAIEEAAIFSARTHISILSLDRVVDSLPELEEEVDSALRRGLSVFFITGPSLTADIEGNLVQGVHGSQNIHVILLEEV